MQFKNHAIGKLFFSFRNASTNKKLYIIIRAGMFVIIYQNIISCYKFYKNSFFILENMDNYQ